MWYAAFLLGFWIGAGFGFGIPLAAVAMDLTGRLTSLLRRAQSGLPVENAIAETSAQPLLAVSVVEFPRHPISREITMAFVKSGEPASDSNPFPVKDLTATAGAFKSGEPINETNPLPVKDATSGAGAWTSGEPASDSNPLPVTLIVTAVAFASGEPPSDTNPLPIKIISGAGAWQSGNGWSDTNPVPVKFL